MPVRYSNESSGPSTRRVEMLEPTVTVRTDFAKLTKAELVAVAELRGVATSGTKAELLARLTA